MSAYQLPTVWQDEASNQGAFTGLNKPTAGARLNKPSKRRPAFSTLYSSNSKWDQGDYYAGRTKRVGCGCGAMTLIASRLVMGINSAVTL